MRANTRAIGVGLCGILTVPVWAQQDKSDLERRLGELKSELQRLKNLPPVVLDDVGGGFLPLDNNCMIAVATFQSRTRGTETSDGSMAYIVPVGSLETLLADFRFNVNELSPFARRTSLSFRLSKTVGDNWIVSYGLENVIVSGGTDSFRTNSLRVSKALRLSSSDAKVAFSRGYVSVGAGDGRLRSENDIESGRQRWQAFAGIGTNLDAQTIVFARYNGQDWNAGLTYLVPGTRIFLSPALSDITGRFGRPRFALSLGLFIPY